VLIRWGDPVLPGAPEFDPMAQTAEKQRLQFGYNNDYLGYFPIDGSSEHGLLCVNHEYTNEELMFPGVGSAQEVAAAAPAPAPAVDNQQGAKEAGAAAATPAAAPAAQAALFAKMTPELAAVEMAAHGGSVLEVRKGASGWEVVQGSRYARRITAETPMEITGPAAGHDRMKTKADPAGTRVLGMINNCAGGMTPWGTWLSAEENFNGYFWGKLADDHPEARNYKRVGLPGNQYNWGAYHDRFDIAKEPNEGNRFGWMVEIDPFDPASTPKKRTALGRFKHEGADHDRQQGRAGRRLHRRRRAVRLRLPLRDRRPFDPANRAANMGLLDEGTLSAARYDADGSLEWLPLVHGRGPLTAENGFDSQADVLIETRRAADLVGATKMDRPEDIEPNEKTGKVYLMLTNNTRRKAEQADAANPRPDNAFGHIVEMTPPDGDHAADRFAWEILVKCGDPSVAAVGATFSPATTKDGWFGMPDNCAIDGEGRPLDRHRRQQHKATGRTDGLWALETEGEARGTSKYFFRCPVGAELCGPMFTPDTRPPSSRSSTRARRTRRARPAASTRPPPAGPTSRRACRPARRSSSSPRRTAA
jgi:secreted PhoX family phosphatase